MECSSDILHPVIDLVRSLRRKRFRASHSIPSMVDEHLKARVRILVGIHYEPSNMSQTINPVWPNIEISILLCRLKFHLRGGFKHFAVQDDFLHALVSLVISHNGAKQLVGHATLDLMTLSVVDSILEGCDLTIDQVSVAFEFL